MKKTITANYNENVPALIKNGKIIKGAEKEIEKLINTKNLIEAILEELKNQIAPVMEKDNASLIEMGNIKITRSINGRRYSFDPDNPVDADFIQNISYQSVNTKKVDAYIELNEELPKGIIENARKEKINIEIIEE